MNGPLPRSLPSLAADANAPGRPLAHCWSVCVGAGRAAEGLRAAWLEQLRLAVSQCGLRYVRFHGRLHDDMFVYREGDGCAIGVTPVETKAGQTLRGESTR